MKPVFRQSRILFLDFDGVLHATAGPAFVYVEALAAMLHGHDDVRIVITSSHRIYQSMVHMIEKLGPLAGPVIDATPVIDGGRSRQREIECWLDHRGIDDFRVLDDDPRLFDKDWPPLILCDSRFGLNKPVIDLLKIWLRQPHNDGRC